MYAPESTVTEMTSKFVSLFTLGTALTSGVPTPISTTLKTHAKKSSSKKLRPSFAEFLNPLARASFEACNFLAQRDASVGGSDKDCACDCADCGAGGSATNNIQEHVKIWARIWGVIWGNIRGNSRNKIWEAIWGNL